MLLIKQLISFHHVKIFYAQSLFAYKNVYVYEHRSFVWYTLSIRSSASSNEIEPSHTVAKV